MVLHELDDRVDRLPTEVVLAAAGEGVRLVDEQRAAERRLEHGACLRGRLADVAGDEVRPVGLDEVALGHEAERAQDLAEEAGHRRLAGARVAGEDEVVAGLQRRQLAVVAQLLDAQQARQPAHVGLHRVEADEVVELGEQLLDLAGRRQRCGGRCRGWSRRRSWPCCAASRRTAGRTRARDAGGVEGGEQHPAEAVDGGRPPPATVRGRRRRRRGRGASRARSSGRRAGPESRASALTQQVEERARAIEPAALVPAACRRSRRRSGVTITGGSSRGPMSSSQARSSSPDSRPSLSNTAAVRSLASMVTAARSSATAERDELARHPVDERVDVLGEDPGHAGHRRVGSAITGPRPCSGASDRASARSGQYARPAWPGNAIDVACAG